MKILMYWPKPPACSRFTCYWFHFSEIPFKPFTTNDYQFVLYFPLSFLASDKPVVLVEYMNHVNQIKHLKRSNVHYFCMHNYQEVWKPQKA